MTQWTAGKVLSWAQDDFKKRGMASPRLEAEVLLSEILNIRRLDLYTGFDRPLQQTELNRYRDAILRRRNGEPVAYITGKKEFWSLSFEVTPDVLIPRPDTETLVEAAIARLEDQKATMMDLCTGTGCVAVSVAHEIPKLTVDIVDVSAAACEVAARNIAQHDMANRIRVFSGDLFAPIPLDRQYDVITANPPYVPQKEIETLQTEVQKEPVLALDGGPDGLDIVRRIIDAAPSFLKNGGWLLMEVDPRQTDEITNDLSGSFSETIVIPDLSGSGRVVGLKK